MLADNSYGIVFFLAGNYHVLCRNGKEYRFHILKPHEGLIPAEMDYYDARKFIEAHPVCANYSHHEIRIIPFSEIMDLLQGKSPTSFAKLLHIDEEEDEEPLH